MLDRILPSMVCLLALGCASSDRDRAWVASELDARGFATAGDESDLERLRSAVDEDAAIALALARSPTYQMDLARLDAARADLDEASRLANPQITLLGALGPVSAMATLIAPLESLWQLPQRSEAAARELENVAESLVQSGLDLARDARVAHIDRGLAEDRQRLRAELAGTWRELARIAEVRARLGETGPAEAAVVIAEASVAIDALRVSETEAIVARARLRTVLGLDLLAPRFEVRFARVPIEPPPVRALLAIARSSRPDVRAAELAIRAAMARAGWERSRIVAVAAQVEGHWTDPNVLAMRIGGRIELPIFGANPGGIGRADAEVARATARLDVARQRVVFETVQARARVAQAAASLVIYRADVLPSLDDALRTAVRTYELGEDTYVIVLDVLRRIADARLREAELVADARRADAELERAIGARLERTER